MPAYGMLHLACNDPDNGEWRGRFREVNITFGLRDALDDSVELEAPYAFKVREQDGVLVIRGKRYPYRRRKSWFGNWCWDMWILDRRDIKRLVRDLRSTGRWSCTTGPTRWFEWFNGKE